MRRRWPFTDRAVPVVAWRLLILLTAVFAEVWNIANMLRSGEPPTEHFAYFTVQANLMVIALMAWLLLVPERRRPRWFDHVRGAITAYIVLTGLVYAVLLAKPDEVWAWSIEFTNAAQHRFIPWMVGLDWLLVPTAGRIRVARAVWWMSYPVAYLVAAWLRGGLVDGWFPYPFLDPGEHGGWAGLVWPTGQVLIAFVVGILVVAAIGALRHRESAERSAPVPVQRPARDAASLDSSPSSTSSRPYANSSP
ncbi:Pr6Pr family membrane protein [Agrococcus sp. HG114]|uniref:Pr6Pr family membrane protein n=1 Tax=Agrococcus sp. HG114 TaxID=2969757 RepID=UPI00215B7564|nr:Pr6Pr family membrane protein [Agrococcus sp. HG114]MCR8669826.1 Pr6Pr family membrane protein [Agrococcus sp. HG114]